MPDQVGEPSRQGYCSVCERLARVWKFNEEVVASSPRTQVVISNSVCGACLKLLVEAASEEA